MGVRQRLTWEGSILKPRVAKDLTIGEDRGQSFYLRHVEQLTFVEPKTIAHGWPLAPGTDTAELVVP